MKTVIARESPLANWAPVTQVGASEPVLADLSMLPRIGVTGAGSCDWYTSKGVVIPPVPNSLQPTDRGTLLVRLSAQEFLELALRPDNELLLQDCVAAEPLADRTYAIPRLHSHACLGLRGEGAVAALSTICSLDLREASFPNASVAQSQLAGVAAILLRHDCSGQPGYLSLIPSALAAYVAQCLLDASAGIRQISQRDFLQPYVANGEVG